MRSRRSITPEEIAWKWVRKLKEEIVLISTTGAQSWKKSRTREAPEIVNKKQITTLTTKAIT